MVQEEFVKELQERSSYKVVNEAGADVLRVKVNIVDLYVNAPDTESLLAEGPFSPPAMLRYVPAMFA